MTDPDIKQLIAEQAAQGALLRRMEKSMEQQTETAAQVAILLQRMKEDRDDKMDLFERLRDTEADVKVLKEWKRERQKVTDWVMKTLITGFVILALAAIGITI